MSSRDWVEKSADDIYDELLLDDNKSILDLEDEYENSNRMEGMISKYGGY